MVCNTDLMSNSILLASSIIVRGPQTVAEAAIISIHDALFVLDNAWKDPR